MSKDSEAALLAACKHLLTLLSNQKLLIWRRISTTGIPTRVKGNQVFFAKNSAEGFADLFIALPGGTSLHCELKSSKGVLSDAQKEWKQQLEMFEHYYYVIRSLEDLEAVLIKHGINHWSFKKQVA